MIKVFPAFMEPRICHNSQSFQVVSPQEDSGQNSVLTSCSLTVCNMVHISCSFSYSNCEVRSTDGTVELISIFSSVFSFKLAIFVRLLCQITCAHALLTFRHHVSSVQDRHFTTLQRTLFIYLINKYISLFDICLIMHH